MPLVKNDCTDIIFQLPSAALNMNLLKSLNRAHNDQALTRLIDHCFYH